MQSLFGSNKSINNKKKATSETGSPNVCPLRFALTVSVAPRRGDPEFEFTNNVQ